MSNMTAQSRHGSWSKVASVVLLGPFIWLLSMDCSYKNNLRQNRRLQATGFYDDWTRDSSFSYFDCSNISNILVNGEGGKELNLQATPHHQCKFLARKQYVVEAFSMDARYQSETHGNGAVVLNDNFAYIHVWKSGGTTIEKLMAKPSILKTDAILQDKEWLTFVRDPIDHFLSGWAECGYRRYKRLNVTLSDSRIEQLGARANSVSYNERIDKYLSSFVTDPNKVSCQTHSFPQANFLLDDSGKIYEQLNLIGDLNEMADLLELVGVLHPDESDDSPTHSESTIEPKRAASTNTFKEKLFPSRKKLISDDIMIEICRFVAIDYFLFDFEPPKACTEKGGPLDFGEHFGIVE